MTWARLPGADKQWLDISVVGDGFEPGTYTRVALDDEDEEATVAALARDIPNYWRIVADAGAGEVASEVRSFVPCGGPFLLWGPLECRDYSTARVSFRWAPVANYEGEQWIEFDSNGDWAGADFWEAGPFSPSTETARKSEFQDGVGYLFRVAHEVDGVREYSSVGWFQPACSPVIYPTPYGSDERLIVPSIGVDAPVNISDVGWDAALGVPVGGYDVVRYEFKTYPEMSGIPGGEGPKLIGGHFDYYHIGPAVFWDLALVQPGDTIQHIDGNQVYNYVVDWVAQVPYGASLNPYLTNAPGDTLMLVTCFGTFDRAQFGGYDQRTLVHAVRQ